MKRKIGLSEGRGTQVTGRLEDACSRYGIGKCRMRDIAEEAKAVVRVGRIYLINFQIMDEYMRKIAG